TRGENGEGDNAEPGTRIDYDLHAYDLRGQPASMRSTMRVHHDTDLDVPAGERAEVIVSVRYSDGFGRVVQTRTQAEDMLFGQPGPGAEAVLSGGPASGGGVRPADKNAPVVATVGRVRAAADPDNVRFSGGQVFDNKGGVVQAYEPFFSTGFDYGQPSDALLG